MPGCLCKCELSRNVSVVFLEFLKSSYFRLRYDVVLHVVLHSLLLVFFIQISKLTGHGDVDLLRLKLCHPFSTESFLDCVVSFHLCSGYADRFSYDVSCFAFQSSKVFQFFYNLLGIQGLSHLLPVRFISKPVRLDNRQAFKQL